MLFDPEHPSLWPGRDLLRALAYCDTSSALHGLMVGGDWRIQPGGLDAWLHAPAHRDALARLLFREPVHMARRDAERRRQVLRAFARREAPRDFDALFKLQVFRWPRHGSDPSDKMCKHWPYPANVFLLSFAYTSIHHIAQYYVLHVVSFCGK